MAGPSIVVRVLGDTKGLSGAFTETGRQAQKASTQIHGAFTGVLGTLNRTGVLGPFGESIAQIDESITHVTEHAKGIGTAMLGVGGTLAGVGVGLQAIGSADKAAHQQLQAAVQATGHDYEEYASQVEEAVKHQEHFGRTANQTQDALRILTQATHDPAKALQLLNTAADVAAAKHEDLQTAATQVGKVFNGNTKLLKEYGIVIDKTTGKTKDGKTATQALADVTKGQASAAADTFSGKLDAVKAKVEDAAAAFGQKYGPAITAAGAGMTLLGGVIKATSGIMAAFTATQEGVAAAEGVATAAAEAETVAVTETGVAATAADVALAPIIITVGLIVAAIAALIGAAYLLYRNWSTIWAAMKVAAEAVWTWIKSNWPYLTAILLGPIALAAAAIYKHWGTLLDFFKGIPPFFVRIGKDIANAFVDAINWIIHAWDSLHFTIGGWKLPFPPHTKFPGVTISTPHVPDIPHLARGGLITQTGLVFAHAGEAITPIDKVPRGPAMHIENATFNDPVDVDVLSKRLEFALGAGMPI